MVEELWKLALVKEIFPSLLFPPQHLLSLGPSLHSFTAVGWKSLLHRSCGHQLPFTQPPSHFSILSDLRKMDFLSCLFSVSPSTLTACWQFEEQVYIKKPQLKVRRKVFSRKLEQKIQGVQGWLTAISHMQLLRNSFLLTIRTGFTVKQQLTSWSFPGRFCAVLEGLIRNTNTHH